MELNIEKPLQDFAQKVVSYAKTAGLNGQNAMRELGQSVLTMGRETSPGYGVDASALSAPMFVGDSNLIKGQRGFTAEVKGMYERNPNSVGVKFTYDSKLGGFVLDWSKNNYTRDAAGPMINGSLLAPNAISYFKEVFMQPLAWSSARKFVTIETGTDPWAEVLQQIVAAYAGNAAVNLTGSPDNTMNQDVEIQSGVLAQPVINVDVTWKMSMSEMKRAETAQGFPFAGQLIGQKPIYAKWLLDLITDAAIIFGNTNAGTLGILNINSVTDWTSIGTQTNLTTLAGSVSTTPGQSAYAWLAGQLVPFITALQNKARTVMVGMSPTAYNYLGMLNYSTAYNPSSALKILVENFLSGAGPDGVTPDIQLFPDPLLGANTVFNPTSHDRLIFAAPELATGVEGKPQKLLSFGMPLEEFVYPSINQGYLTQYKYLRRISGVFAPLSLAVKCYSNFGV